MTKIANFITELDSLLGVKTAFVPAPQQQQAQQGGGSSPQDQQAQQMLQQVSQQVQSLPPDVQQQATQQIQQVQQFPPDKQIQALQQISQGLQGMQGGGQQPAQGQQPQGANGQDAPPPSPGDPNQAQGQVNTQGHVNAENQLHSMKMQLTPIEVIDLMTGGKGSKSLIAVKQQAHQHNQKMQQMEQKSKQDAMKQQMEAQVAQQASAGGLYNQAPDMSGKMGPGAASASPQPQTPGQGPTGGGM